MFYFVNDNIQDNKSGIEHAELKRLRLFDQHHVPAKIVTRQQQFEFHRVLQVAGVADQQVVNLFDFFQEAEQVPFKRVTLPDLHWPAGTVIKAGDQVNQFKAFSGDRLLGIVTMRANDPELVSNVQLMGFNRKTVEMQWYDYRGFVSMEQFFNRDVKSMTQQFLTPAGKVVLQKFSMPDRRGVAQETYRLVDYHGKDWVFDGLQALFAFFLDELNRRDGEQGTFIVDRAYELAWSIQQMRTRAFKIMHLHNNHLNHPDDVQQSPLNSNYEWILQNLELWDGLIALTTYQYRDLKTRYGDTIPLYRIPGPIVSDQQLTAPHMPWDHRQSGNIIQVARLSPEKQHDQLLKAFATVQAQLPDDTTLHFWGYTNGDTQKTLTALTHELGLDERVVFEGYTEDLGPVYDQAQLLVLPSRTEGLPLTLVEAQSHGLPMIANDIKYGPSDVIIDGQDGILTQNGDIDGLGQALVTLMTDPGKRQQYSEAAYRDSARFSTTAVWRLWQPLIADAQAFFAKN